MIPRDDWEHLTGGSNGDPREIRIQGATLRYDGERVVVVRDEPTCCVCDKGGPGLTQLADRRYVHRWPCRERLQDG
jgi:hypothetical protein